MPVKSKSRSTLGKAVWPGRTVWLAMLFGALCLVAIGVAYFQLRAARIKTPMGSIELDAPVAASPAAPSQQSGSIVTHGANSPVVVGGGTVLINAGTPARASSAP